MISSLTLFVLLKWKKNGKKITNGSLLATFHLAQYITLCGVMRRKNRDDSQKTKGGMLPRPQELTERRNMKGLQFSSDQNQTINLLNPHPTRGFCGQ